jgi:chromosomal replication initiator protein
MNQSSPFDRVPPPDAASTAARLPEPEPTPTPHVHGRPAGAERLASDDVASVWERVRQSLQERIRPEQFHTWFQQAELRAVGIPGLSGNGVATVLPNTVQLAVQNNFTSFFIKTYYMEQLVDALGEALGGNPTVEIVVDAGLVRSATAEREPRPSAADRERERFVGDAPEDADGSVDGSARESLRNDRLSDSSGSDADRGARAGLELRPTGPSQRDLFGERLDTRRDEQAITRPGDTARRESQRSSDDTRREMTRSNDDARREPLRAGDGRAPRAAANTNTSAATGARPSAPRGGEFGAPSEPVRGRLLSSSDVGLNPTYRFETFVVGPCNRFAHAAAVGVSEQPGLHYNPLFLHGNVGLGKTHLIQSLCHAILTRDPGTRILYLSCESFVNHFVDALDKGDLQRFRNKYRNVDVLVVDDIHLLANKERTQEEFFHTFNTLYNSGKQIVLSSDSPPKEIPTLQDRLVSRFKWGLVTEIETPCYETRRAILKRKSREKGNELPDDVASDLAEAITANIRELEGAVTRLLGYAALSNQPVSVSLARECLRDLFEHATSQPNIEDVLRVVTSHFQIRLVDLQSRKRTHAIAFARQVGMYLARRLTRLSLQEIGGHFGGRDHSTVLYAVERIREGTQKDAETLEIVRRLEASLSMR